MLISWTTFKTCSILFFHTASINWLCYLRHWNSPEFVKGPGLTTSRGPPFSIGNLRTKGFQRSFGLGPFTMSFMPIAEKKTGLPTSTFTDAFIAQPFPFFMGGITSGPFLVLLLGRWSGFFFLRGWMRMSGFVVKSNQKRKGFMIIED